MWKWQFVVLWGVMWCNPSLTNSRLSGPRLCAASSAPVWVGELRLIQCLHSPPSEIRTLAEQRQLQCYVSVCAGCVQAQDVFRHSTIWQCSDFQHIITVVTCVKHRTVDLECKNTLKVSASMKHEHFSQPLQTTQFIQIKVYLFHVRQTTESCNWNTSSVDKP